MCSSDRQHASASHGLLVGARMRGVMRTRIVALLVGTALLTTVACVSASSTTVRVGEPQPVGTSQRSAFRDGDVQRVVVISAVPAELEQLLGVASIERTVEIAGRTHHVGRVEGHPVVLLLTGVSVRSEERRVGEECRSRCSPYH